MKSKVGEQEIDEILSRGVEEVIDIRDLKEKLLSGKTLRIKLGIDPTSPNLHLGRSVPLLKLRDFQKLAHKIVFIVGDFTGVIGDTSDKDAERPMLDSKTIKENLKTYKKQVGKIIDISKADFKLNSSWLKKLNYVDIAEQANIFSINQFISRDNIRRRLDEGKRVSVREMIYPLMQGYDSVAVKSDVEIGGTDQKFNLLSGRDMQKHFGQEPQNIIMNPIIEGLDGRKMSSSWGNTVNFLDSANEMFGKIMSLQDVFVIKYFEILTRVPMEQVYKYRDQLENGENPKNIKIILAKEIVKMYHSEKDAESAHISWEETFSKGGIPTDIEEVNISNGTKLKTILVENKIVESNSEFTRLLKAGAIKNAETDEKIMEDMEIKENLILKVGKRRFVKIIVK
jgi:tyrosyl-tRNA synthetase